MKSIFEKVTTLVILAATMSGGVAQADGRPSHQSTGAKSEQSSEITQAEVEAAQAAWGRGLVSISEAYEHEGPLAAKEVASQFIRSAYAYEYKGVLFKPTLTSGEQTFRNDFRGALAYFVGQDDLYPSDSGFALKGWRDVQFDNEGILFFGASALLNCKAFLTNKDGQVVVVNKSLGFIKTKDGKIKLKLHHSSLPYNP